MTPGALSQSSEFSAPTRGYKKGKNVTLKGRETTRPTFNEGRLVSRGSGCLTAARKYGLGIPTAAVKDTPGIKI